MAEASRVAPALPFWLSLTYLPVVGLSATWGDAWILLIPAYAFIVFPLLDALLGGNPENPPEGNADADLFWHSLVTWVWAPIQFAVIWGTLWWIFREDGLDLHHGLFLMLATGVVSGSIGVVYAHELIHRKNIWERRLGEWLMVSVLYGHFVTEHIAVHHRFVGTPRDAVTARYNESFYRFFLRVVPGQFLSAWSVEAMRMRKRGLPVLGRRNPFWRYMIGAFVMCVIAFAIGGWACVGLYVAHAFVAVLALEQVNYIEHYGLVRKYEGNGKYEYVKPHHSWNSDHIATNSLMINLQRHADHHVAPDRRYPLLRTYSGMEAPPLPFGYPIMVVMAMTPNVWRRVMNPRVRRWRSLHYPEILDWSAYNEGRTPMPAGA